MRKVWWWLLVFFWAGVKGVLAGNLSQVTIRLDRMVTGESPLPVLVMVKTETGGVEEGIRIRVGDGWTVSNEANNITVTTTGLPTGVTAWPGIGTAVSVVGQTVNFPSNDLDNSLTYGFFITGGVGVNPIAGDNSNYKWQVMTLAGGNPVDQTEIKISVSTADSVVITGKIGAKATDFQLEVTADKTGNLSVGEEITYQINYGSYLATNVKPLVISAEWSRGTINGSPVPSVDIADYVVGSGTTAWGGISPVIDLVNRKISWTINSFPANTINQTVEFKLRVNDSYSGSSDVLFKTTSYLNGANVITISSDVDNVYHPVQLTPTASQTTTTGSVSSPTATPTITAKKVIVIEKVEIATLSDREVKIRVNNNVEPETVKIIYGLSINQLSKSVTSINKLKQDIIGIDGLKPGTDYYFKIEATDNWGNIFKSDIYTFKTAIIRSDLEIDTKSLLISADDNILLDAKTENNEVNAVVMITNQEYSLRVNLNKPENVKKIKILVKNALILGINSIYGAEPNSMEVNLVEINQSGFVGHLVSPKNEGYYEIAVRIEDTEGNILENNIGEMRVVTPLTITDEEGKLVENAKVEFYRLNPNLKIYELIGKEVFGIQNPSYTDYSGQILVNLPKGDYRINVSEVGYSDQEIDFSLGLGTEEKMPTVILKKTKVGWLIWSKYYGRVVGDTYNFSKKYLSDLTTSQRFYKLSILGVMITWIITLWLFISQKLKIYWWHLPKKIVTMIKGKFTKYNKEILRGKVIDSISKMPISGVKVFLTDDKLNKVLSKTVTDDLGEFRLVIKPAMSYRLAAVKESFEPTPMLDFTAEGIRAGRVEILMNDVLMREEKVSNLLTNLTLGVGKGLASIWLWGLMLLELIFWKNFGLAATWPWVIFSWLSVGMWLIMILKKDELEKN